MVLASPVAYPSAATSAVAAAHLAGGGGCLMQLERAGAGG